MKKKQVYFLGFLTLLAFPAVGFVAWYFIEKSNPFDLLVWHTFFALPTLYGLAVGLFFAALFLWMFSSPVFKQELRRQRVLISSMNLSNFDRVFLSLCAGVGEELLFRACIQQWLGIWITSILFVAIHGYLNPKNWKLSLYGLSLLPFILLLAYGYEYLGFWFSVAAHFSYDLLLFWKIRNDTPPTFVQDAESIDWNS